MTPEDGGTQADPQGATTGNGATGSQAGSGTQPPAGNSSTQADDGDTGDDQPISLEAARKIRSENQGLRNRLKEFEKADEDRRKAGMSDLEKANTEKAALETKVATLEGQIKVQGLRYAAHDAAVELGMKTPELAHRLIDISDVEFDDEGSPKNLKALLKKVTDKNGYLLKEQGDFGGGNRGAPSKGTDMNALIRGAAGRSPAGS